VRGLPPPRGGPRVAGGGYEVRALCVIIIANGPLAGLVRSL
jgi:hypothetical protein